MSLNQSPNEIRPVLSNASQLCGGYGTLVGASGMFLPFIDHLIGGSMENRNSHKPRVVGDADFDQLPETNEIICGLPAYDPSRRELEEAIGK